MRAFLAVPVEQPALGELQTLLESLRQSMQGVRWSRDDGLHITVHFLGSVSVADAQRALDVVRPVVAGTARFELQLDTLGSFPPRGQPRVLWAAPSQATEVSQLAALCHQALRSAGFEVEDRLYRPHCTLGRVGERSVKRVLAAWHRAAARPLSAPFTASRIVLFESLTRPDGAIHVPRAEQRFDAAVEVAPAPSHDTIPWS